MQLSRRTSGSYMERHLNLDEGPHIPSIGHIPGSLGAPCLERPQFQKSMESERLKP